MTAYRLWPSTDGPSNNTADTGTYTLGMQFSLSTPGKVTAIYFWRAPHNSDGFDSPGLTPTRCGIFDVASHPAGPANTVFDFTNPGGTTGWIRQAVDGPDLEASRAYKVCVYSLGTTDSWYSSTPFYWSATDGLPGASGITSGIIIAPNNDSSTSGQDAFVTGGADLNYPGDSFHANNYWIDVEITVDDSSPSVATFPWTRA